MEVVLRYAIIFYLIFSLLIAWEAEAVQHFAAEPTDVTVKLGDNITLPCKVTEKKGVLQWTKDGFGLGTNRSLHGFNRYEMIGSVAEGNDFLVRIIEDII